jgi:hypothetical protein
VIDVFPGAQGTCGLLANHELRCWGIDFGGIDATKFEIGGAVAQIAISNDTRQNCALLTTGGVRCWGNSAQYAELGYANELLQIPPAEAGDVFLGF